MGTVVVDLDGADFTNFEDFLDSLEAAVNLNELAAAICETMILKETDLTVKQCITKMANRGFLIATCRFDHSIERYVVIARSREAMQRAKEGRVIAIHESKDSKHKLN